MDNKKGTIIQGFDVLDITRQILYLNKKHQASLLSSIEDIVDGDDYFRIRKLILDSTNGYCRSILNFIFGDIHSRDR